VFGPVQGTLLSLLGATAGATAAFALARHSGGGWLRRRLDARDGTRLAGLVRGIEQDGWRFVAFVRLVPLFPFNVLNYALGLTRIRLGAYVVTSLLTMVPGAAAYAYLGYAGRAAAGGAGSALQPALLGLALLAAALYLLPRLARRLRGLERLDVAQLSARLAGDGGPALLDVRGRDEFCSEPGHIPGSVSLPLEELSGSLRGSLEPLADRRRELVVVCKTERRSTRAAQALVSAGFSRVSVLTGGVEAWHGAGHPMASCGPARDPDLSTAKLLAPTPAPS
jgi:rhodanese-related sulfurtransferase/membrane protein DedA with SNARE-associated domain